MKVFVINLLRSTERKQKMTSQMALADVNFEFFTAIDASNYNFKGSTRAAPHITKRLKGYTLLPSEIACYASHLALWEKCVNLNQPIVILEDNIELCSNFKLILNKASSYIESFPYIKLSATMKNRNFNPIQVIYKQYNVGIYSKGTQGTTAYIISPKAAQKFIECSLQFIEPVDNFMEKPWKHGVQAYSVYPSICNRTIIESTIGSKRKKKENLSLTRRIFIECYRGYESLMTKIYWKH